MGRLNVQMLIDYRRRRINSMAGVSVIEIRVSDNESTRSYAMKGASAMKNKMGLSLIFALLVMLIGALEEAKCAPRKGFMLSTKIAGSATLDDHINKITSEIEMIANMGGNIVRFPVYFAAYQPDVYWWLRYADAAFNTCYARGVNLVIDFHHPGVDMNSTIKDVDDFVWKWGVFAQHFSRSPQGKIDIWYDLCNEPKGSSWPAIALRAAREIRKYDQHNKIVYAFKGVAIPNPIPAGFQKLPGINNQIIEFHFYNDGWDSLQFSYRDANPGDDNDTAGLRCNKFVLKDRYIQYPNQPMGLNKTALEDILRRVQEFGRANNVPVYIGETAIFQGHPNAPAFIRDFTSISQKLGIHLTLHAFRDASMWNYECNGRAWEIIQRWLSTN